MEPEEPEEPEDENEDEGGGGGGGLGVGGDDDEHTADFFGRLARVMLQVETTHWLARLCDLKDYKGSKQMRCVNNATCGLTTSNYCQGCYQLDEKKIRFLCTKGCHARHCLQVAHSCVAALVRSEFVHKKSLANADDDEEA